MRPTLELPFKVSTINTLSRQTQSIRCNELGVRGFTSICCKMCAGASGYSVSHAPMILSAVLWHSYPHLCSSVRTVIQPFHSHTLSRLAGQECVFLNGGHKANCWQCVKGGRDSSMKTTGEVKFLQLLTVGSKKLQQQANKFRKCWLSPTGIH